MYQVGDKVEVLTAADGSPYTFPHVEIETDRWVETEILDIDPYDKKLTYWVSGKEVNSDPYWVHESLIRPLSSSATKPSPALHHHCVECKEVFLYPVEANCVEGRLCFSCRSSYGWKYQILKESA